jgi:hypothetical protein
MASILAILLASAIAASTESIVRRLRNNVKDGLCLWRIAAVRGQSSIAAIRARKCIIEFLHDGARMIDRVFVLAIGIAPMRVNGARHDRSPVHIAKDPPVFRPVVCQCDAHARNVITLHLVMGNSNRCAAALLTTCRWSGPSRQRFYTRCEERHGRHTRGCQIRRAIRRFGQPLPGR